MRMIKKLFFSIWCIIILNIMIIRSFVYADEISLTQFHHEVTNLSTLYYIAIFIFIAIIVGISIYILRKIDKNNQLEKYKDEENEKGEKE